MRIALLTSQFPGVRLGGIGAYTLHAARALAAAGHDVHVFTFCLPADVQRGLPPGVIVHELEDLAARAQKNTLTGNPLSAIQAGGAATYRLAMGALLCDALRRVHAEKRFDVVEGPEYEALTLPLMMEKNGDVPVVTHLHSGSAVARLAMDLPHTSDQLLQEALEFAAILMADGRCAPSRQVILDTQRAGPVGEAEVVPLPYVTEPAVSFVPPNPRGPVLFLGRLEFIKGAHLLPEALNRFLARHLNATARIVGPDTPTAPDGSGSMQKYIQRHLSPAVLSRIAFLGEQPRERVLSELTECAFVVVPSLFESYSYVCCEALAAGRAIVVSDGIGATEVVNDAGVSFARGDAIALAAAIERLYGDTDLLHELSERAYRRSREVLSPEAAVRKRIEFYERVVRGHTRNTRPAERLEKLPTLYVPSLVAAVSQMTAILAGVPSLHATPGLLLADIMDKVSPGGGGRVVLYGAGRHTSRLMAEKHVWEMRGHRIVGIIDDHPRFREEPSHLGLPVDSVDAFAEKPRDEGITVVLSTDTFTEQFWEKTATLRAKGIRVLRLYA